MSNTVALPDFSPTLAFPAQLVAQAQAVAWHLGPDGARRPLSCFAVRLDGESLFIPERVYYAVPALMAATQAGGNVGLIALCLGTRHHDGFVRERCLRQLLDAREAWTVPFVVRLAGEYVAQIVALIEERLPSLDATLYGKFLRENPGFLATTERRVTSYWYAYQHAGYRERGAEPGSHVVAAFKRMAAAGVTIGELAGT
jgi:hypothetical protein